MNKKILIPSTIFIIIVVIVLVVFIRSKNDQNIQSNNQSGVELQNTIESIKESSGAQGNTDIYTVVQEDDNEYLTVKDDVLYQVALAGILKQDMPKFEEIEEILKGQPAKSGIWISEKSREKFLKMVNKLGKCKYSVNQEGYLEISEESQEKNEVDEKLNKMLNEEHQYCIDISGKMYDVDNITGEIVEYPFERMMPTQTYEYLNSNKKTLVILSTNEAKLLTEQEILESLLDLCTSNS